MSRYFSVRFDDLTYEAQESMTDSIIESLLESYKTEGERYLQDKWHDPQPKTWQEAFCRINAIKWDYWSEYERNEPDAEIPDWEDLVKDYAEEQARLKLVTAMKYVEVEVEF